MANSMGSNPDSRENWALSSSSSSSPLLLLLFPPLSDHRVRVGPGPREGGVPLAGAVLGPDDVGDVLRHEGDGH